MEELFKIEVVTSISKLSKLTSSLNNMGVTGVTVLQALGCGVQNGTFEYEEELNAEFELLPKTVVWMVVDKKLLHPVIEEIKKELYTGHIGDGKIFITPVYNVIRIRTGEEGEAALK